MTNSKTYLNVPYAQKDAAKAQGARWDAAAKKWYVPTGKDMAPFAQWQIDASALAEISTIASQGQTSPSRRSTASNGSGVFTYPGIANFTAYSGNEAPWD